MVKAISGVMTVRFKNELVRNITIKLGYANAKVRPLLLLSTPENSPPYTTSIIHDETPCPDVFLTFVAPLFPFTDLQM